MRLFVLVLSNTLRGFQRQRRLPPLDRDDYILGREGPISTGVLHYGTRPFLPVRCARPLSHANQNRRIVLEKQPGAERASLELPEELLARDQYLEVMRNDEGDFSICVRDRSGIFNDAPLDGKPIMDYPVSVRIELAEFIPDLLDNAVACESEVAADAMEAGNLIQQALARL